MTLTPEDLQRFCSDDESRPSICHPFSQEKWTYATDGRLLIRVPRLAEVPEYEDAPKMVDAQIFGTQPITGDLIFAVNGRAVALEVKLPGCNPTEDQVKMMAAMKDNGWRVEVVRSLDEARAVVVGVEGSR